MTIIKKKSYLKRVFLLSSALFFIKLNTCISQTLFFSTPPTLESGPPLSAGAVYRFANGGVINSTQTDLLLHILGFSIPNVGLNLVTIDGFGSVVVEVSFSLSALTSPLPAVVDLRFEFVEHATTTPKSFNFVVQSFDIDSSVTVTNNFTDVVAFTGHYGSSRSVTPATAIVEDTLLFSGYSAFYMPSVSGQYPDINIPYTDFIAQRPYTAAVGYANTSNFLAKAGTLGLVPTTQRGSPRGIVFNFNNIVDIPAPIPEPGYLALVLFVVIICLWMKRRALGRFPLRSA